MSVEESLLLRKPPQNLDAEQSILGAILLENTSIDKALELIMPDDFYKEAHRKIFLAMIDLADHGEAIDLITLPEALRKKEELEKTGGLSYISNLLSSVPNAANIRY
ncbi:MAG: DnaB-like helicase N-terminal domain-containing protein, partial [Nitrospirota bacterium]